MTTRELKQKREDLALTQRELGELLDITAQQISNYESGRIPIPKVVELALGLLGQKTSIPEEERWLPLSKQEGDFVRQFVAELKESLGNKIILTLLFGSKARGEGGKESDMDILILLKAKTTRVRKKIFGILFSLDPYNQHRLSPVIYSLKDFQMNERLQSPFILNIKREGILL